MKNIPKLLFNPIKMIYSLYYYPVKPLKRYCSNKIDISKCYKILGINENSDQDAVRVAYIEMVKRFHPDSKSKEADASKFQEIEMAYRNLQEKFIRERYNKNEGEGEYGLYHVNKEVEEADIDHTAPQHRQYLSYEGVGSGTPAQRQKQYTKFRATKAMENITDYKINKLQSSDSKSLTLKENRKVRDIKTRYGFERLVEDLIQQSMVKGEFDNLPGKGKPLKNLQRTHNPYVDFVTHKMNEVLIENGFTPTWITLQKEISEEREKIKSILLKHRRNIGQTPLSEEEDIFWENVKNKLQNDVKVLNGKIDFFNLVVPLLNKQQFHFNLKKEAEKVLKSEQNSEKPSG